MDKLDTKQYEVITLNHKILSDWFEAGLNVMLIGKHGTSKSSQMEGFLNQRVPGKWVYFSGSTLDPWTDIIGIPMKSEPDANGERHIQYIRPEQMNPDIEVIVLDEYNRSHKKVRNALMELIQFKSINGKKFHKLKAVWVAINPPDEKATYDVDEMDAAQLDRFHVIVNVSEAPSLQYFTTKYGQEKAEAAIEWHNNIPGTVYVSPRRLDYALDLLINKRIDPKFALPKLSNPKALVEKVGRDALVIQLDSASGTKRISIFKEPKNYAELCRLFKEDIDFRRRYQSNFINDFPRENFMELVNTVGIKNVFSELNFDVTLMENFTKVVYIAGRVTHPQQNLAIFFICNAKALGQKEFTEFYDKYTSESDNAIAREAREAREKGNNHHGFEEFLRTL